MLASSFLSAEQLGLSTLEHAALHDVLGRLERGELRYVAEEDIDATWSVNGFNMATFNCWTVHCIGGWADRLHGTDFAGKYPLMELMDLDDPDPREAALHELFFADEGPLIDLENVTTAQAAEALRNYLTTGDAQWGKVVEA